MAIYECHACTQRYDDPPCKFDSGFKRGAHFKAPLCPFGGPRPANWRVQEGV